MSIQVPVVYHETDSFFHRRDSRIKVALFGVMAVFIFLAPTWQWMLAFTGVGIAMAFVAKLQPRWAIVLFLLQVPNILALLIGPTVFEAISGDFSFNEDIRTGLKLSLTWAGALFVSISLASTMEVDEITDGMRGLKLPEAFCFLIGYVFVLFYVSISDILRVADAMRIKGVQLETKNPFRFVAGLPRLLVPAIFVIVRRAGTMMSVLQMRGFSFTSRSRKPEFDPIDVMDVVVLAIGILVVAAAAAARFDLISIPLLG
ncbi:MAG: energy-coupling factor transporter transmembrane component T family protein [Rubrobacteraceae bacterium]